jgi:ketosteroid isomerase-like protein
MSVEDNKAAALALMHSLAAGAIDRPAFTEDATWWTLGGRETTVDAFLRQQALVSETKFAGPGRFDVRGPKAEGDRVAIEAEGSQPLRDGRVYENSYHWLVCFRDGKICRVRTYFDTAVAHRAMNPTDR